MLFNCCLVYLSLQSRRHRRVGDSIRYQSRRHRRVRDSIKQCDFPWWDYEPFLRQPAYAFLVLLYVLSSKPPLNWYVLCSTGPPKIGQKSCHWEPTLRYRKLGVIRLIRPYRQGKRKRKCPYLSQVTFSGLSVLTASRNENRSRPPIRPVLYRQRKRKRPSFSQVAFLGLSVLK